MTAESIEARNVSPTCAVAESTESIIRIVMAVPAGRATSFVSITGGGGGGVGCAATTGAGGQLEQAAARAQRREPERAAAPRPVAERLRRRAPSSYRPSCRPSSRQRGGVFPPVQGAGAGALSTGADAAGLASGAALVSFEAGGEHADARKPARISGT